MKLLNVLLCVSVLCLFAGCKWCCCSHCHEAGAEKDTKGLNVSQQVKDAVFHIANVQLFEEKVLKSTSPILVAFSAAWCGACQTMTPVFNKLATDLDGKFVLAKIDVDEVAALADRYKVQGIPTFIIFKDGKEMERFVGVVKAEKLQAALEKATK